MKKFGSITAMALFVAGGVLACSSSSNDDNNGGGGSGGGSGGSASGGSTGSGGMNAGSGGVGSGGGAGGMGGAAGGTPLANVKVASDFTCPAGMQWGDPLPPEGMRTLTLVKDGLKGGEGGIWVEAEKALYFSDLQRAGADAGGTNYWRTPANSKIWKHTPADNMTTEWLADGGSNGMNISADLKKLVVAYIADRNLTAIDLMTKNKVIVADKFMNAAFKATNDLAVRSDGNIYFSDPLWQSKTLNENECGPPAGSTKVFRADATGNVTVVADNLINPNGVALSPDGRTLYVTSLGNGDPMPTGTTCNAGGGKLTKFAVNADGSTGPGTDLVTQGIDWPDGVTVDCAGNIYVTSGTVKVFKNDGMKLGEIALQTGGKDPSNVAFGGTDRKTLFVMMGNSVGKITLNVPGPN